MSTIFQRWLGFALVLVPSSLLNLGCEKDDHLVQRRGCFPLQAPCPARAEAYEAVCSRNGGMVSVDSEPEAAPPPNENNIQTCCYLYTGWKGEGQPDPSEDERCSTVLARKKKTP